MEKVQQPEKDTQTQKPNVKRILAQCCKTIRKIKVILAENVEEYHDQIEDTEHFEDVFHQVWYLKSEEHQNQGKDYVGEEADDLPLVKDPSRHCTWTCQYIEETFKFSVPKELKPQLNNIVNKYFTKGMLDRVEHLENANEPSIKAIEKLMQILHNLELGISKECHNALSKAFSDKLDSDSLKYTNKMINKPTVIIKEQSNKFDNKRGKDGNKKDKGKQKDDKRPKNSEKYTEDMCDAIGFLKVFRETKSIIKNRNKENEFIDNLMLIITQFAVLSKVQQKNVVQLLANTIETKNWFGQCLLDLDRKEWLYYWVCFEYILSIIENDVLEEFYKNLTEGISFYEIKRIREDFISDLIDLKQIDDSFPLFEQIAQRICHILVDEVLTFSNKSNANTEQQAKLFWKVWCLDVPKNTANILSKTFDFILSNKISLHQADVDYINKVAINEYLEPRLVQEEQRRVLELEKNKEDKKQNNEEEKQQNNDKQEVLESNIKAPEDSKLDKDQDDEEETIDTTLKKEDEKANEGAPKSKGISLLLIIDELREKLSKIPIKKAAKGNK